MTEAFLIVSEVLFCLPIAIFLVEIKIEMQGVYYSLQSVSSKCIFEVFKENFSFYICTPVRFRQEYCTFYSTTFFESKLYIDMKNNASQKIL